MLVTRHSTFDITRPFLRQQGLKAGLTKHQLDGPAFHSIFRSVRLSTSIALDTRARAASALLLAVEYDGRQHAESPQQWGRDVARREHLDDAGWRVIVLRATDVYDTPWESVGRIMAAMAARGFETDVTECPEPFRAQFPGRPWRSTGVAG